jgi:hypothetical protein
MEMGQYYGNRLTSLSYTMDTFIIQLNQEDDGELEYARVDVERNNILLTPWTQKWMLFRNWALVLWTLITKRQTLWASVAKQRKICKVQREVIVREKARGGLGIGSLIWKQIKLCYSSGYRG